MLFIFYLKCNASIWEVVENVQLFFILTSCIFQSFKIDLRILLMEVSYSRGRYKEKYILGEKVWSVRLFKRKNGTSYIEHSIIDHGQIIPYVEEATHESIYKI